MQPSIGIIGYGDFGRFLHVLAQRFLPEANVLVSSFHHEPDGKTFFTLEEVCKADYLVPCVPIAAFAGVIEKIAPLVGRKTIVCDVATVKKHTVEILKAHKVPRFIATHPMFGPYSYEKQGDSLLGLRIAICESTLLPEEEARSVEYLKNLGLDVQQMSPDAHDKLIAETLFLTHLVGQIVKTGKFVRTAIDTLSFGFLMDAVESVAHDDELFRDVFTYNPYCKEVLTRFEDAQKEVLARLGE